MLFQTSVSTSIFFFFPKNYAKQFRITYTQVYMILYFQAWEKAKLKSGKKKTIP